MDVMQGRPLRGNPSEWIIFPFFLWKNCFKNPFLAKKISPRNLAKNIQKSDDEKLQWKFEKLVFCKTSFSKKLAKNIQKSDDENYNEKIEKLRWSNRWCSIQGGAGLEAGGEAERAQDVKRDGSGRHGQKK